MFRGHLWTLNEDGKFRGIVTVHIRVVERIAELFLPAAVPSFRDFHVPSHSRQVLAMTDKCASTSLNTQPVVDTRVAKSKDPRDV